MKKKFNIVVVIHGTQYGSNLLTKNEEDTLTLFLDLWQGVFFFRKFCFFFLQIYHFLLLCLSCAPQLRVSKSSKTFSTDPWLSKRLLKKFLSVFKPKIFNHTSTLKMHFFVHFSCPPNLRSDEFIFALTFFLLHIQ